MGIIIPYNYSYGSEVVALKYKLIKFYIAVEDIKNWTEDTSFFILIKKFKFGILNTIV